MGASSGAGPRREPAPASVRKARPGWARVVAIGVGNIGSHLAGHLIRMPEVGSVLLIDPDRYAAANVGTQDIEAGWVGQPKADVQAARLRRIAPGKTIEALASRVEDVPLGRLRSDVLVCSPDSRRARQAVNSCAIRLGIPVVDAGVEGTRLLARIDVRAPSPETACGLCHWGASDYGALEQEYACGADEHEPVATGSPSFLGALAASVQAAACARILRDPSAPIDARQVIVEAVTHSSTVTTFRRNPACRADHARWAIERLETGPAEMTVAAALALGPDRGAAGLRLPGQSFARRLVCRSCGQGRSVLALWKRIEPGLRTCDRCGSRMDPRSLDAEDTLDADTVSREGLGELRLAELGLRAADVISVGEAYFELGA